MGYVIVDKREPKKWKALADYEEDILVDFMVIGDVSGYVIERKTLSDFLKSMYSGRLWKQLDRIQQLASEIDAIPVLLLVGDPGVMARKVKSFKLPTFYGAILSIEEKGIVVIQAKNYDHARVIFSILRKRVGKNKVSKSLPLKYKKVLLDESEQAIAMLEGVSGVGYKKAERLLEKYGSVREIVNLPLDVLVSELGEKTGSRFYRVVNGEYED